MTMIDESALIEVIARVAECDVSSLSASTTLESIGWDSLSQLGFVAELDAKLGLAVNPAKLQEATTIAELLEAVIRE